MYVMLIGPSKPYYWDPTRVARGPGRGIIYCHGARCTKIYKRAQGCTSKNGVLESTLAGGAGGKGHFYREQAAKNPFVRSSVWLYKRMNTGYLCECQRCIRFRSGDVEGEWSSVIQ